MFDQLQLAAATVALIVHEAVSKRGVLSEHGSYLVLEATRRPDHQLVIDPHCDLVVRIGLHSAILCPHGCLAADTEDGLLVVLGVHAGREDAEWDFLSEEYYTSLEPPDLDLAEAPAQAHEYTTVE